MAQEFINNKITDKVLDLWIERCYSNNSGVQLPVGLIVLDCKDVVLLINEYRKLKNKKKEK
jgi:uncharacterized membrane protein